MKRKIKKTPLSRHRCPYCDSKITKPLGVGPSSRQMVKMGKELGLRFSEHSLKHFVREGLLPRPVKRPMEVNGKATSIGIFPESAGKRLRLIAKMKMKGFSADKIKDLFRSRELLYE